MATPGFGAPPPHNRPHHTSENHWLDVRQQPEKARVVVRGKEKGKTTLCASNVSSPVVSLTNFQWPDRKPVDPPPIVQLKVQDPYNDTW